MINLLAYASGRLDVTLAALVPIAPRPPDRLGDAPAPWSRVAALASEDQDVARAMLRLTEVVDTEFALVKPETIARWSEDTTRTRTATSARASLTGRFRLWRTTTQSCAGPRRARPASPSPPMSRPTNAREPPTSMQRLPGSGICTPATSPGSGTKRYPGRTAWASGEAASARAYSPPPPNNPHRFCSACSSYTVSYTHLRAHETDSYLV